MATSPKAEFVTPLAAELAADVLDRLLRYVRIDTQSAHGVDASPSTEKQLDLSRLLRDELEEIGLEDVRLDEFGYVYGSLPGVESAPAIGYVAHVDTSPDVTGTGVDPQVHEAYDGGTIELPGDTSVVLDPEELPLLKKKVGHDIVTTDGTTLLGADDKAGVAEIMAAVAYLKRHPELEHAPIRVCFTVDEEVAGGADHLEIERFGARYAYTLDGAELGEIEAETFNASKVTVTIRGRSTHPGTAKGQLVNAIKLAADLVSGLPRDELSPETTEEREGFVHPTRFAGGAEEAVVEFIVRDHDAAKMTEHVALIRRLADEVREREPRASIEIEEEEQYRNMGEVIDQHPEVIEAAVEAVRRLGVEPVHTIIRGGTDGARLSAPRPADAEPLHRRLRVPLPPRVGERAGHGRGGRDARRARPGLGRALTSCAGSESAGADPERAKTPKGPLRGPSSAVRLSEAQSQGGGLCTQRPPTIVATTCSSRSSSGSTANGSRSSTTRSASSPGRSRPRRRSSPERKVGATHVACSACSTVSVSSGRQAGRSSIERSTPAATPAIGSSSSTGASEPFATSAPDSSSERKE